MTHNTRAAIPTTALITVGDETPSTLTAQLGLDTSTVAGASDLGATRQVVILIPPAAPTPFSSTTDDDLSAVDRTFVTVVHTLQHATRTFREQGDPVRSIVILLPAKAALGERNCVLPSMLAGAVLSFARTIAIELKKDAITVNTVLYGGLDDAEVCTIHALLETYRTATTLTGQETYTASGPNLGRIKP
ncbi:hypothetical protein G352_22171 [Rhodococcus ruber BKS 20-38]|uniref:SDR family oxidoreductase n=1 Tax=Rhodococcus ruber BKS 20-38 TaxID=1278076 RepID=M2X5B4_9NOCA|nr:hypothetical protein [Rhodococcus ruber]EME56241.1 hypothetical protein G352_22171 [Rhodococcus ruber BKS 20-38]